MSDNKVSFTVRRPTPASRAPSSGVITGTNSPLARSATNSPKPKSRTFQDRDPDSSDEESIQDELVTGFDQFGVQRCVHSVSYCSDSQLTEESASSPNFSLSEKKQQPQGPLVIPALQNKDWRALAKKRRTGKLYVPDTDIKTKTVEVATLEADIETNTLEVATLEVEETEDQKAIRALLSGDASSEPSIAIIPPPMSETDVYRQDMEDLPDQATLEDYARVPVSQFGAALLRGMGWKEGTAASRTRQGIVEPWLPTARPALLGIGAKEKEVLDDGSKKPKRPARPQMKYVPLTKRDRDGSSREGSGTPGHNSGANSRRRSLSPLRRPASAPGERARERDGRRDWDRDHDRDRDRDRRGDRSRESSSRRRARD
jgi:hypothetical protein